MAMHDDLNMYYCDSWVSIKGDDYENLPFLISRVEYVGSGDEDDLDLITDYDYAMDNMRFYGTIVFSNGRADSHRIMGSDPKLVLETPDLGYSKNSADRWVWNTMTACHSVKKGIINQRLYGNTSINNDNVSLYRMFNYQPDGVELLHKDVVLYDNKLEYKGVTVGAVVDVDSIEVVTEYELFIPWFKELLPTCQITLATPMTNQD